MNVNTNPCAEPAPWLWRGQGGSDGGDDARRLRSANDGQPFLQSANDGNPFVETAND
jgi:hypothetical protein